MRIGLIGRGRAGALRGLTGGLPSPERLCGLTGGLPSPERLCGLTGGLP